MRRWLKPSTQAFFREARRTPGYSWRDALHGYIYARWPYLYIGVGTGEHPLARWLSPLVRLFQHLFEPSAGDEPGVSFADSYHGKVLPLEQARELITIERELPRTDLEQVIPYARARDIVLRNPQHIAVLDCPCRAARPDPCLPLDVCLIIGEPFVSFVVEHHPERARRITAQEAEEILRAEAAQGHVHHAFFKDAMLDRFYAICNCCSCCCGAMQGQRNGVPMLAASGYICHVDRERCVGCSACAELCPFGALAVREDGSVYVEPDVCMGCGVCVSSCPQDALALARDPERATPLEIRSVLEEHGIST